MTARQFTREEAIAIFESNVWETWSKHDRARIQLTQDCLLMPFAAFHTAMECALGRELFAHEFTNREGLIKELFGEKPAPTIEEILALIPTARLVLVIPT